MTGKIWLSIALVLILWSGGCNYERMNDQEAIRTYATSIPETPPGTVPYGGGIETLKHLDPRGLKNPLPDAPESAKQGKAAYEYFCIQCHGPQADGKGTVGQSFAPLPTSLKDPAVQSQEDGVLFVKISLGFRRHPPLASTVSDEDRWAAIRYIRSLAKEANP